MVSADVSKPETFKKGSGVFDGVYGVFLVTNFWDPSSMFKEVEQGKQLVDAAFECGVQHVIWPALPNVAKETDNKIHVPHFTDKALVAEYVLAKGFKYTSFAMPAFYYQNFASFFPPKEDKGVLVFTIPATDSISMYDVEDTGGVVHTMFSHPHHWGHGNFVACSGDHLSPEAIVATFAKISGKQARLNTVTTTQFAQFGFPYVERAPPRARDAARRATRRATPHY